MREQNAPWAHDLSCNCLRISTNCFSCRFVSCLIVLVAIVSAGCSKTTTPPAQLVGIWTTSGDKYEGRFIEISEGTLVFGVGNNEELRHTITDIDSEQEGPVTKYTIHYRDREGEEWILKMSYDPGRQTFLLQNRDEVWEKGTPL